MKKEFFKASFLTYLYGFVWLTLAGALIFLASLDVYPQTQIIWSTTAIVLMFILRHLLFKNIRNSFAPIRILRLLFMLLAGMIALRYIWWRTFHSLPVDGDLFSLTIGFMLYLAELQATIIFFMGMFIYIFPKRRDPVPLTEEDNKRDDLPTVDIFIPTFNEPSTLLRVTLLATKNVRYPKDKLNIFLLDDGGTTAKQSQKDSKLAREAQKRHNELKQLCHTLNVNYLTREKNDFAKAGNINAAMKETHGDLILILDCDHIPTVDFLQNTVSPFMKDEKLYLVQTPHFLINDDPIEKNTGRPEMMPSESEMFYTSTMRGLDTWNAAFFCGSGAVLRRKYLEEIGGICTQTVTEDIETSVELHSRGYHSIYYHKPMLAGLQPETFAGFMTQRLRWAHGMLQVFMLKNPLLKKGLNLGQRIALFNMVSYWFFSYMRIMFLLAPVAYLLLGANLFDAQPSEILLYALPNIIAFFLYFNVIFGRQRWFLASEVYETLQCIFSIGTVLSVLINPKKGAFNVTPKDENVKEDFITPLAWPLYILFILVLTATVKGIISVAANPALLEHDGVVIIWSLINTILLIGTLGCLHEKKQVRHSTRFKVNLEAQVKCNDNDYQCQLIELSATGLRLQVPQSLADQIENSFYTQVYCKPTDQQLNIHCKVVNQYPSNNEDTAVIGAIFTPQSVQEEQAIMALGYGDSERWRKILANRNVEFGFAAGIAYFTRNALPAGIFHIRYQLHYLYSKTNFLKKVKKNA